MSTAAVHRKAPSRAETQPVRCCQCDQIETDHPSRRCRAFQPKPCGRCGEPYSAHQGSKCSYREDPSPAFLIQRGIPAGKWQFVTIPQLEFLMRPETELKVRVWACGMKYSIGQRGRLAVKGVGDKRVALRPVDIVEELNALDPLGRATRQSVRKALWELEREGATRRVGTSKGKVRMYFYFRPLSRREVPEPLDIVVKSDYNVSPSDTNDNHLPDDYFSHFRGQLVKGFRTALRKAVQDSGIVGESDYNLAVEQILEPALKVVENAYNEALIVVRNARTYKEDSSTDSSKAGRQAPAVEPASQPEAPPDSKPQTEAPPDELLTGLIWRGFAHIEKPALDELRRELRDTPLEQFYWPVLDERLSRAAQNRKPIGVPIVIAKAREARTGYERLMALRASEQKTPLDQPAAAETTDQFTEVESHQCLKCGGKVTTYADGVVSNCRCARMGNHASV